MDAEADTEVTKKVTLEEAELPDAQRSAEFLIPDEHKESEVKEEEKDQVRENVSDIENSDTHGILGSDVLPTDQRSEEDGRAIGSMNYQEVNPIGEENIIHQSDRSVEVSNDAETSVETRKGKESDEDVKTSDKLDADVDSKSSVSEKPSALKAEGTEEGAEGAEEKEEKAGEREEEAEQNEEKAGGGEDEEEEDVLTVDVDDGEIVQSEEAVDDSQSSEISSVSDGDDVQDKLKEDLLEQYRQAVMEHKAARETNLQLQTKLAEYFRRKRADAAEQQSAASSIGGDTSDNIVDYEQRYNKYISSLTDLKNQYQFLQASYQKQIEELKSVCEERQKEVDNAYREFTDYKFNIGKKALHSKTGKPINQKELVAMLNAEQKKEATVMEVRLENIKLKNEVAKVEAILKSKEELAEGLHLIDFEQLKIENQTYNEKIEERHEELEKLKRKIASTVQIMTHVKEKLQAVQFENSKQRERLGIADAELTFNRDQLAKLKHARDKLRADNLKLRRSCGLLGRTTLLLNYEDSVDAVKNKKAAIEETKRITEQYVNKSKDLLSKIERFSSRNSAL